MSDLETAPPRSTTSSRWPRPRSAAIYDDSPLQRRFRDAYTATAHFQVNEASRELQGRLLLGQPTDPATL